MAYFLSYPTPEHTPRTNELPNTPGHPRTDGLQGGSCPPVTTSIATMPPDIALMSNNISPMSRNHDPMSRDNGSVLRSNREVLYCMKGMLHSMGSLSRSMTSMLRDMLPLLHDIVTMLRSKGTMLRVIVPVLCVTGSVPSRSQRGFLPMLTGASARTVRPVLRQVPRCSGRGPPLKDHLARGPPRAPPPPFGTVQAGTP